MRIIWMKQEKSVGELIEDVLKYAMEKRTNKCKDHWCRQYGDDKVILLAAIQY
jgi:hypothetical protein